jgi:four helix bundle protein
MKQSGVTRMKIDRFEDIIAWQKARELVAEMYKLTNNSDHFKKDFGLRDQIRKAAVSAMSNIAEGFGRHTG